MKIFTLRGAQHYCTNFQAVGNVSQSSLDDFNNNLPDSVRFINEGTTRFNEYRASALRDAERCLFLASSHYRRALDLMIPSASHWAFVTLYYGSWFAANAILAMFGCRVFYEHVVEVERSTPGNQRLSRLKIGNRQNQFPFTKRGSHQRFWEAFYATAPHFSGMADQNYVHLLSPIAGDTMWLIHQRNRVNYKMVDSIELRNLFVSNFTRRAFPNGLPGELSTQFSVCEGLLHIGVSFASQFGLSTDALNSLGPISTFREIVRRNVYWPIAPRLVPISRGQQTFGV